jgi:hypothetical protein
MAKREEKQLRPARILALGFLMMIGVGTILLSLPLSSATGKALSFVDALFTATSGICVTGLIIKNTATDFSLFGKIVILILIQTGGLGYMTLSTIISLLIGKRISLKDRLLIAEAYNVLSLEGLVRFTKSIFKITIAMEFLGAFVLFSRWLPEMNPKDALFHAIFQSVSAFNNAGFSSFSDNLLPYRHDLTINLTVMILVVMGGIGYIVISDSYRFFTGQVVKLAFHTKMVLTVTAVLIGGGTVHTAKNPRLPFPLGHYPDGGLQYRRYFNPHPSDPFPVHPAHVRGRISRRYGRRHQDLDIRCHVHRSLVHDQGAEGRHGFQEKNPPGICCKVLFYRYVRNVFRHLHHHPDTGRGEETPSSLPL